jgi:hypothetical protein
MGPHRSLKVARRLHARRQCARQERASDRHCVRAVESQGAAHSRHDDEHGRHRRVGPQVEEAVDEFQRQERQRSLPRDGVASGQRHADGDGVVERRATRHSVLGLAQHVRAGALPRIAYARRHVALVVVGRSFAPALVRHRRYAACVLILFVCVCFACFRFFAFCLITKFVNRSNAVLVTNLLASLISLSNRCRAVLWFFPTKEC